MDSEAWLKQLISFNTTSRLSNLQLIYSIQTWLAQYKINSQLSFDATGQKANLFATLPAEGNPLTGGLILSGHTDVVPIEGQVWETDPFIAVKNHDRIYGRGACDMKGFIAVVLALVPEFVKLKLKKPLHFAFSYDEEVGCLGAPVLITHFQSQGVRPTACIVGEPTEMHPVIAHKGIQVFRCQVTGHAVHSSLTPQGCNAIEYAAQLICSLRDFSKTWIRQEKDPHFDVPYTTMTSNMIKGGNSMNTVPNLCEFFFEFRNLPKVSPKNIILKIKKYVDDILLPEMKHAYPGSEVIIAPLGSVPAFEAALDVEITKLVYAITRQDHPHKVSYATEAGIFQNAGISTLLWGPGSIREAHGANEFIALSQLTLCKKWLLEAVQRFNA